MHKIFLIIFAIKFINADDDEGYEKYIDLLPEEEKQEFLNRIARRILEDVNSHDTPNESHADINDEQLNAQNDFVNDIIKEESKTLLTERRDADKEDEQQNTNRGDDKDNNVRYVDLTLRTNKRDRRNNSAEPDEQLGVVDELKIIPVKTIYDEENAVPDDKTIAIPQSLIKSIADNTNTTEFETNNVKKDSITVNDSRSSENLKVIRKSYDDKLLFRTTISDYNSNSDEINPIAGSNKVSDTTLDPESQEIVTTTENNEDVTFGSTQIIYDSENDNIDSNSSEETMPSTVNATSIDEETTTITSNSNFTAETEINKQETTTLTPQTTLFESDVGDNITINKQTYIRSGNIDLQQTREAEVEKNSSSVTDVTEEILGSKNETVIITTTEYILNAGSFVSENNKSSNQSENTADIKSKKSESLRYSTSQELKLNDTSVKKIKIKKNKVYEVFEIEAGKTPFVKESNIQHGGNEVPLYSVPVYNYDPKYSYFLPRTRFGPDTKYEMNDSKEENNQDINFVRSIFSGYKKRNPAVSKGNKKNYVLKNQNKDLAHLLRPVNKQIPKNIYNNPNDYIDVDYYFDRSSSIQAKTRKQVVNDKILPDSHEELHPYNCFLRCDSVKDHIGAVRKILHMNKLFGYSPEMLEYHKFNRRNKGKTFPGISREKFKPDTNNIAMDYYFGLNQNQDPGPEGRSKINKKSRVNINESDNGEVHQFNDLIEVLRDFIRFNNEALVTYDWLETTVNVLSPIKLFDFTKQLQFGQDMTSKDLELLKYILYLYKSSVDIFKEQNDYVDDGNEDRVERKKGMLPKNKYKNRIKEPLKLWKDVAKFIRNTDARQEGRFKLLYDFDDFLQKIKFHLNDLHDAIKHIAIVTKYDKQKWFEDLKSLYLNDASDKKLLQLLLHLSVSRLFNYIEESGSSGVEDNFREYIKNNERNVRISKEEILFVLNVLKVLKQLK